MSIEEVKAQVRGVIDEELHPAEADIRAAHAVGSAVILGIQAMREEVEALRDRIGGEAVAGDNTRGQVDEHARMSRIASTGYDGASNNLNRILDGTGNNLTTDAISQVDYAAMQTNLAADASLPVEAALAEAHGHLSKVLDLLDRAALGMINGQEYLAGGDGALQSALIAEDNLKTYVDQR